MHVLGSFIKKSYSEIKLNCLQSQTTVNQIIQSYLDIGGSQV